MQKEEEADEEQGLWHKVEWKMAHTVFERTELSLSERAKGRIGNNFYKLVTAAQNAKEICNMIMSNRPTKETIVIRSVNSPIFTGSSRTLDNPIVDLICQLLGSRIKRVREIPQSG